MAEKRIFKTSRQLTIQKTYRAWADWEVGDIAIGEIIGSSYSDKSKKFGPIIKVLDSQFKKTKENFVGKNLVLNPAGMLNKALVQLGFEPETGKMGESEKVVIQVTYTGSGEIASGAWKGKDAHSMDVQVVEEDLGDQEEVEL